MTASRDKAESNRPWNTAGESSPTATRRALAERREDSGILKRGFSASEFRGVGARPQVQNIPQALEWADGHILLQEHGNEASFRNIKILVPAGK